LEKSPLFYSQSSYILLDNEPAVSDWVERCQDNIMVLWLLYNFPSNNKSRVLAFKMDKNAPALRVKFADPPGVWPSNTELFVSVVSSQDNFKPGNQFYQMLANPALPI
jgi:hypothetical protein